LKDQNLIFQRVVPEKKKRKRKIYGRPHQLIPFPTHPPHGFLMAPNSDICFKLPKTILRALESGDEHKFRSFMMENCIPDVESVSEYKGEQNPFGPNHRFLVFTSSITPNKFIELQAFPRCRQCSGILSRSYELRS
jgi:hypothetical protein